ncbi:MAG: hypothetical protein GTO63_10080 [Anaerolineae bacterium]|nr:hypothetical protein [Anaerolineae bacterium]NIN95248.1 hypothetical protein [Anaerolineae bacterium]
MRLSEQVTQILEAQIPTAAEQAIIDAYKGDETVEQIVKRFEISYYTLYSILHRTHTTLRTPAPRTLWVLDKDTREPTEVPRTEATLRLRKRQVEEAYYASQDIVTAICKRFHISWRTLYRICPPNRRVFSVQETPE